MQICAHVIGRVALALRQHLCSGVTSLRNEGGTLLNRMDGLPDRFDHECMCVMAHYIIPKVAELQAGATILIGSPGHAHLLLWR